MDKAIALNVKTLDGNSFSLEAERGDSVLSVKELILNITRHEKWGVAGARLLYLGRNLDITRTLGECGMMEGGQATLHLLAPPPPDSSSSNSSSSSSSSFSSSSSSSARLTASYSTSHGGGPYSSSADSSGAYSLAPSRAAAAAQIAAAGGGAAAPAVVAPSASAGASSGSAELFSGLRHQLGVCMAERDAARGEAASLKARLLSCEEKLAKTAAAFEAIVSQLGTASQLAASTRKTLLEEGHVL
jgi:hypothetical protein